MSSDDMGTGIAKTIGQVLGAAWCIALLATGTWALITLPSPANTHTNAVLVRKYLAPFHEYSNNKSILLIDQKIAAVLAPGDTVLLPHDGTSDFCIIERVDKY